MTSQSNLHPVSSSFDSVPVTSFQGSEPSNLTRAIASWTQLIDADRVVVERNEVDEHGKNAIGSTHRASVILRPSSSSQIADIMLIALENRVVIYPISTGRNWGYGAASPCGNGEAVLELSDLTTIRVIDETLGIVEVEPGVTQQMLYRYLQDRNLDLLVPVHGGGPDCSILGNALERGYGLTPTTDHFQALTSLEAVLPDGTLYRSGLHSLGADLIGSAHRWGIGPYLDGMFSQGNFGIVTKAVFTLRRRAQHTEAFFLQIADDKSLGDIVESLREMLSGLGAIVAGVNLMNDRRVLSMSRPYPNDQVDSEGIMSQELCNELARGASVTAWTAAGIIHCPTSMIRSVRRELKRMLPASSSRPMFFNRGRLATVKKLARLLPAKHQVVAKQVDSIDALLDLADGVPRRVALPLAYWLKGDTLPDESEINPARNGCGLIWYSPLVPMRQVDVQSYIDMVRTVCTKHGIEPLITLTSLSERLFDSTVPILYRTDQEGAADRAHACYGDLVEEGSKLGCLPYRLSTRSMDMLHRGSGQHQSLVRKLKDAIDPFGLIAPGRYSPDPQSN
ncbi:FAD-binding oxidoreductase [Rubripirellula reticaptiva]|uniref:4-cresol dehydrogenase [hydroxylating] flavoprotein subunit n=1 Tax=Rubripirellula reticaptiva TaxID=2528013 RepID=A0A5C6F829_9BACT|nr:FAD-binding oxidoreductase [Rubripirellula reticaptiva]TWU55671.1 4-cresol dehydrogenase [hydroxylating] flavoprotein subunit [Rubripirellula reticaptiva]